MSDVHNRDHTLDITYELVHENTVNTFDDEMYIDFEFYEEYKDFIFEEDRKNDYEFKYKHYLNQQVKIEVPEGFDVSYIPPSIEEKHPNFSFKVSFEQEGNYIMYHKEISIPAARVKKEDMELWNSCIEKLQDTYKEQLAFKKQK